MGELLELLRPIAEEKGLEFFLEADSPVYLRSDRGKLRQIVTNLISNALKFTESGHVRVRVSSTERDCEVSVIDSGPGISNDQIVSIFDEFTQAARRTDVRPDGTGLGLAISRKLARLLGGDVVASSEVGVGSTFTLCLPLVWGAMRHEDAGVSELEDNTASEGM